MNGQYLDSFQTWEEHREMEEQDALIDYAETLPRDDEGNIDVSLIGLQVIEAYL